MLRISSAIGVPVVLNAVAWPLSVDAREFIAREGYDPVYGARPLRRLIAREVETRVARALVAGEVVDGSTIGGDITESSVKDRRILGEEGFVSIVLVIDRKSKTVVTGPDVHARGVAEDDRVFDEIKPKITAAIEDALKDKREHTTHQLQQTVRRTIGPWVGRKLRRKPMIVPVVLEADRS